MAEAAEVKVHLPVDEDGGGDHHGAVSYQARSVSSPPPKELESLNNAANNLR